MPRISAEGVGRRGKPRLIPKAGPLRLFADGGQQGLAGVKSRYIA
jgi:hypothetical protein